MDLKVSIIEIIFFYVQNIDIFSMTDIYNLLIFITKCIYRLYVVSYYICSNEYDIEFHERNC